MNAETILLAIIGSSFFGMVGALVVARWKKPKDDADTIAVYQKMVADMRDEYEKNFKELLETREEMRVERKAREDEKRGEFASREKERQANEARYKELEDKFDQYKHDSEYNTSILSSQVSTLKNELEKSDREKLEMKKRLQSHDGQLSDLTKKVTGPLPSR